MRNKLHILAIAIGGFFILLVPALAEDDAGKVAKEYQVKAAFLYNFVKFVKWPGEQSLAQTHTANICIAGENPFGSALDVFKRVSTAQLTLNVIENISTGKISSCHILFISPSEYGRIPFIIEHAKNYPVLTVSEVKGFVDEGGIIEMVKVEQNIGLFSKDKINLRINLKMARAEGIDIDPQLLEIAAEVIK